MTNKLPFLTVLLCVCLRLRTDAVTSPDLSSPIYPLPYYSEVSTCPCDITNHKCDVHCCCDKDCPEEAKKNLTCIPGLPGGVDLGKIIFGNCSHSTIFDHDHFSLVCIQRHNSPFLGLYYDEVSHVSNLRSHQTLVDRIRKRSSDDSHVLQSFLSFETGSQFAPSFSIARGYKFGSPLRTVYDYSNGVDGIVELPMKVGSACHFSAVRFLKNSQSTCPTRLTPEICNSGRGTILDYQMYLIHAPEGVPVSNVPEVLRLGNKFQKTAPLHVNYFRVNNGQSYVKSQQRKSSTKGKTLKQFDTMENLFARIGIDEERDLFGRVVSDVSIEPVSNIFSQIYFNEDEMTCVNLVFEVQYRFFWSGEAVDKIEVDIFLGNLTLPPAFESSVAPVQSDFEDLNQFFSATFIHKSTKDKAVQKSGEPGYDPGRPLVVASQKSNSGFRIDPDGIRHWSNIDSTSLCRKSFHRKVNFFEDVSSGCFVELVRNNFTNCRNLRSTIKSLQKKLISANYISKGGSLNATSGDEFVSIIFEEKNFEGPFDDRSGDLAECIVPHQMHVEVMYTRSSKRSSDQFSIYRVCGARVKWIYSRWSWMCRDQKSCGSVQRFPISMFVEHFEVPVNWHYQNTSRFWVLQDWGFCHGDRCWNELMFPFSHVTTGDEISYSIACAAFLIPSLVFITWFTKDEW